MNPNKKAYYDQKLCINGPHPNDRYPRQLCSVCQNQLTRKQKEGRKRKQVIESKKFLQEYLGIKDTPLLVHIIEVEQEGGLYQVKLTDHNKNRITALMSGSVLWSLVQQLTSVITEENRKIFLEKSTDLPFVKAYKR